MEKALLMVKIYIPKAMGLLIWFYIEQMTTMAMLFRLLYSAF